MPAPKPIMAMAWYRPEDYERIRKVSDDEMQPSFAAFEAKMTKTFADLSARGTQS